MRVLVTGSAGRVGRAIHARLCLEHDVLGLDQTPSPSTDLVGDITDSTFMRNALRGVDAVVHAAALHAPHVGAVDDDVFERVNVQSTRALADLAVDAGVGQLVFTSTTALYGSTPTLTHAASWINETVEPQPRTIYHRTKLAAEALLEALARRGELAVTVLRMSRCFPEPAPLMTAYRIHRGVDARDVADAHALALHTTQPGFRRFVISGATPFEAEDVHELVLDAPAVLARRAPALVEAFARRGWALPISIDRVYSPALALRELGWQARYGFDEVLRMLDAGSAEVLAAAP